MAFDPAPARQPINRSLAIGVVAAIAVIVMAVVCNTDSTTEPSHPGSKTMCTQGRTLAEDWATGRPSYAQIAQRLRQINSVGVQASQPVKTALARMHRWAQAANTSEFAAAVVDFKKACRADGF